MFKLDDIKAGYLLVVNTDGEIHNMTVVPIRNDREVTLGCSTPGKHWWPLREFDKLLRYDDSEIVKIYGPTSARRALDNSIFDRELLWERRETEEAKPKSDKTILDMTLREILTANGVDTTDM